MLVGVPAWSGDAHARLELVSALKNLRGNFSVVIIWNGDDIWGFEDFTVINYTPTPGMTAHEILAAKENIMRQRVLEGDYTHFLSLESDNIPKPDTLEILLAHEKDIVSATYFIRAQQEFGVPLKDMPLALEMGRRHGFDEETVCYYVRNEVIPCVWGLYMTSVGMFAPRQRSRLWTIEDLIDAQQHKLVLIASAGLGCVLISKEVLLKTVFLNSKEYENKYGGDVETHTDYLFYAEALKQGFDAFLDPNHIIKHLHRGMENEKVKWFGLHSMQTTEFGLKGDYANA